MPEIILLQSESDNKRNRRRYHGHTVNKSFSKTYSAWHSMIQRCTNRNVKRWNNYGGRGISVCRRWMSFPAFLEDMKECPRGMSLDRIDNDGNYEIGNCRWATKEQQARNTSRNIYLEHDGKRQVAQDWANQLGVKRNTIMARLKGGWSVARAVTEPPNPNHWKRRKRERQ